MILTPAEARDAMFGAVHTAWNLATLGQFGASKEIRFESIEQRTAPDPSEPWAYCTALITDTRQNGLRSEDTRRYGTVGVLTVDISVPRAMTNASASALSVGHSIRQALQRPRQDGIWFRHVTAARSRDTANAVVVRVVADFHYTEEGV